MNLQKKSIKLHIEHVKAPIEGLFQVSYRPFFSREVFSDFSCNIFRAGSGGYFATAAAMALIDVEGRLERNTLHPSITPGMVGEGYFWGGLNTFVF